MDACLLCASTAPIEGAAICRRCAAINGVEQFLTLDLDAAGRAAFAHGLRIGLARAGETRE